MIFSDFKYMTSTIPDTNAYSVYFGCSSVASIAQCTLHQDVRSVHKFLFGQYGEKNIWNVQQSYMKHSEHSHIELPLEISIASMNSGPTCIFMSSMADYQRARKDGVAEALLTMSSSGQ